MICVDNTSVITTSDGCTTVGVGSQVDSLSMRVAFLHGSIASHIVDLVSPKRHFERYWGSFTESHTANKLSSGDFASVAVGGIVLLASAVFLFLGICKRRMDSSGVVSIAEIRDHDEKIRERVVNDDFLGEMAVDEHAVHEGGCRFGATPELHDAGAPVEELELAGVGIITKVETRTLCELADDQESSKWSINLSRVVKSDGIDIPRKSPSLKER